MSVRGYAAISKREVREIFDPDVRQNVLFLNSFSAGSCHAGSGGYGGASDAHDTVFAEIFGDELDADTGNVWPPDFWRLHD